MQNWISKTFSLDSSSPSGIVWRISPNPRIKAGQSAGTLSKRDGYWRVMYKRKSYLCHRIIMLLTTGRDVTIIDHINGVRQDNSVDNLRIVDNGTNARNSARYSSNSSGVTGVKKVITHGGKYVNWQGFLDYNGKRYAKTFSENVYGSKAIELAIEWRKQKMRDMAANGADFTHRHGT